MSLATDSPEDEKHITLTFELKFSKTAHIVWPNSNTAHDLRIHCWQSDLQPIRLGPAILSDAHSRDDQELIRKWYERRSALSVALAFVDAEFASALLNHMPPPPDQRPKQPPPDKIC